MDFDPNAPARPGSGIFGLPHTEEQALVVLVPVPWEATTSYGGGAAEGPRAILEASKQVDLYDLDVDRPYQHGIFMRKIPDEVHAWNAAGKALAHKVIEHGGVGKDPELEDVRSRRSTSCRRTGEQARGARSRAPPREGQDRRRRRRRPLGPVGRAEGDGESPERAVRRPPLRRPFGHTQGVRRLHALARVHHVQRARDASPRSRSSSKSVFATSARPRSNTSKAQGDRVAVVLRPRPLTMEMEGEAFASDRAFHRPRGACRSTCGYRSTSTASIPRYCPHTGTPVPGGLEARLEADRDPPRGRSHRQDASSASTSTRSPRNLEDEDDEQDSNVGARLLYKLIALYLLAAGAGRAASSRLNPMTSSSLARDSHPGGPGMR